MADPTTAEPAAETDELDLASLVPASWRAAGVRIAARWRPADSYALLIVLGQLLVVGPVVWTGSFYIDDFRAQSYAAGQPFWPWIIESNGTHFAPGARTLDWIQTQWFPLQHGWAVVVTLLVRVLLGGAIWVLLRRLVGPTFLALPALLVLATTASLLPATAWYRQSITELPAVIALLMATSSHVRFVTGPRVRPLVETLAWFAVGLCFLEKTAVLVPWLVGLSLFVLPSLTRLPLRTIARRAAVPVVATAGVLMLFLVYYLGSGSYDKGDAGRVGVGQVLSMLWLNVTRALFPALVGGPWQWTYPSPYLGVGDPPLWLMVVAAAAVLGLLGYAALRAPRTTAALVGAFLFFYLPCAAIVAVGRLTRIGPVAGMELRLWADAVVVLGICLTVAVVLAVRARPATSTVVPPAMSVLPDPTVVGAAPRARLQSLALVPLLAVMLNVGYSTFTFGREWAANPSGAYVARLRAGLTTVPSPASLVAVAAPAIVPNWVQPDYSTEDLLAPLVGAAQFHVDSGARTTAEDGSLVVPRWSTITSAAVPAGWCGLSLQPGSGTRGIVFTAPAPYYRDAQLRMSVLVSGRTGIDVGILTKDGVLPPATRSDAVVDRGAFRLMWRLPDGARAEGFVIRTTDPAVGVCITGASIASPAVVVQGSAEGTNP
ncbi:MAG TPA: hypothetical protein VFL59_01915 [Candidatus Nanopelagicales bacterium]|nr:hypothetical protein [Candidatus Nanopelagicales bacterium]